MDTEDGHLFIKNLAYYVRTHERALANAIQLQQEKSRHGHSQSTNSLSSRPGTNSSSTSLSSQPGTSQSAGTFASALSSLGFGSHNLKPAKLYLTSNHLYYLLSRFEELGVNVGPMNVRLESIHADSTSMNYVSFLTQTKRPKGRSSDQDSLHSVSSVRSVMSSMSSMLSSFSFTQNSAAKLEKRRAAELEDIRYLYSSFTKIPCLKLILDHRIRRIADYEEFPFDTAVPVYVFKNVTVLEVVDQDFRSFFGWDRLADQLKSLTVKRGKLDDPTDLLKNIVLDDMEKRRRRSTKNYPSSPTTGHKHSERTTSSSALDSPGAEGRSGLVSFDSSNPIDISGGGASGSRPGVFSRVQSSSPPQNLGGRRSSMHMQVKKQRRASSSSTSSNPGLGLHTPRNSSSNLLSVMGGLPPTKWRVLRHLCLADNGLTCLSASSLSPITSTLQSLDLSSNLFVEIPESLASLVSLRALNLSNCLIESLQPLARSPLPAITVLNLRGNRLTLLAGIEKLLSLERLDLRDNKIRDPTEMARLTGMPEFCDLFISRNPFTKTHANHRVTIFNLFRQTPGYTEDITVDSSGPLYNERRQLVDRAPETNAVPVVKPPLDDEVEEATVAAIRSGDVASSASATRQSTDDGDAESPRTPTIESGSKSQRRPKGRRRRVVNMAHDSSSPRTSMSRTASGPNSPVAAQTPGAGTSRTANEAPASTADMSTMERLSRQVQSGRSSLADETRSLKSSALPINPGYQAESGVADAGLTASNEQYKRKIEALKREYGNGWLSVLGEGGPGFASEAAAALAEKESKGTTASQAAGAGASSMAKT